MPTECLLSFYHFEAEILKLFEKSQISLQHKQDFCTSVCLQNNRTTTWYKAIDAELSRGALKWDMGNGTHTTKCPASKIHLSGNIETQLVFCEMAENGLR